MKRAGSTKKREEEQELGAPTTGRLPLSHEITRGQEEEKEDGGGEKEEEDEKETHGDQPGREGGGKTRAGSVGGSRPRLMPERERGGR